MTKTKNKKEGSVDTRPKKDDSNGGNGGTGGSGAVGGVASRGTGKKHQLKVQAAVLVERVARLGVAVLVLVGKSWEQGEICLIIVICWVMFI